MKNDLWSHKSKKIVVTLLLMILLVGLSGGVSWHVSRIEEQRCWEFLQQTAAQAGSEIEAQIGSDQELLESIADIIAQQESVESERVQSILDNFCPNTMIEHLAILLPGDRVMMPNGPVSDAGEVLSFETEAALGVHISDRSVDIRDTDRQILRNFVPIVKDGKTVAMLYGVVDLSTMPEKFQNTAYEGQAAEYLVDCKKQEYLMDTWHKTLASVDELSNREMKRGYTREQLLDDLANRNEGYCVFVSQSLGEYMYFYYKPIGINEWMIGISVPESGVFANVKKVNRLLILFMELETILLGLYFLWMSKVTRRELVEKQKLLETDALTGLLNRYSYEQNLHEYPFRCRNSLTCIYADVNGLHTLNNTKGHAAGDRMLKSVAKTIQEHFGVGNTYRIGGDEFVAFAQDDEMATIEGKIGQINRVLEEMGYHVSFGIHRQETPLNIDDIIKQAEKHMYEDKNRYYEQTGTTR